MRTTLLCLMITLLLGCDNEPEDQPSGNEIAVPEDTKEILLEVKSSADNTTIPILIVFPTQLQPKLKAVVVLHGSGGPWDDDDTTGDDIADVCPPGELSNQNEEWRDLLIANDFVAVFPDSYSPRGTCENEGDYKKPPLKFKISGTFIRNRDSQDVLDLLAKLVWKYSRQPIVDVEKIGLVGFSDGGTAAISSLYDRNATPASWVWKQSFDGQTFTSEVLPPPPPSEVKFKAGVIYYPGAYHNGYYGNICTDKGIYRSYTDVMFHLAEEDPLSENSECLIATMQRLGGGVATVHRYENVGHGFDGNDEPESSTARQRSLAFLKSKL